VLSEHRSQGGGGGALGQRCVDEFHAMTQPGCRYVDGGDTPLAQLGFLAAGILAALSLGAGLGRGRWLRG